MIRAPCFRLSDHPLGAVRVEASEGSDVGRFVYERNTLAPFDDRLLMHLQLVIGMKIRRGESFTFSWKRDPSLGDGRTMVWIHPGASVVFMYSGSRIPQINGKWLEALMFTANQPGGLHVVPEPPESDVTPTDADVSL